MIGKNKSTKEFISSIFEWIVAFYFILSTGGILLEISNSFLTDHVHFIQLSVYIILILWIAINSRRKSVKVANPIIMMFVFWGCLLASMISSVNTIFTAILRYFIPIVCGICVWIFVPANKLYCLINKLVRIIFVVCVLSLIFWVTGSVLKILSPSAQISFIWGTEKKANTYYHLYYEPLWQAVNLFGKNTFKNCGIFSEPPMFCFWLCFAYSFYRTQRKRDLFKIIVVGLTILSTVNITAYVYIIIFEVLLYGLKSQKKGIMWIVGRIVFAIVLVMAVYFANRLIDSKLATGSGLVRSDHLRVCIELFKTSFPFGIGIGNLDEFTKHEVYKQGMSLGLPSIFAMGGFGSLIIILFPCIYIIKEAYTYKKWEWVAFVAAFLWTSICTAVQINSPFSFVVFPCFMKGHLLFEAFDGEQKTRKLLKVRFSKVRRHR